MDPIHIQVRMLGEFSVGMGSQEITDSDNRSRKVWLLLAYMIYCRNRSVTLEELVSLLWGDEESSSNPLNALKTMLHRVRSMLSQLGSNAGHTLIVRRDGNYAWNTQVPLSLDVDDFESLCKAGAAAGEEERLDLYLKALDLYRGDFLTKLSSEPWVVPISAYFHNLYVQTVLDTVPMLEARGRLEEAVSLCRKAVELEPYNEVLYRHLMRELLDLGEQRSAIAVYENMSQLLLDNFGIMPSE
ncbi:MAG: SARP family transcriptional regulator, partial [Eubacterium sp.]|nr:SARP family transcriptional regulator [Eubacterium sp.]